MQYIIDTLKNERRQCTFLIIEGQSYLDSGKFNEAETAQIQDVMDGAYERSKAINHTLKQLTNEETN